MVQVYIKAVGNLSRALAVLATGLMIAAMLVVCQMILLRYVFRQPTIWQNDFVVFSATAAMFLGAPYVLLKGGHVGVDVVELIVGDTARRRLRAVASLLGLSFCAIMLAATWVQFHEAWVGNWRHSSVWAPPLWVPLSALPLSFAMLCLQYIAGIAGQLSGDAPAVEHDVAREAVESAGAAADLKPVTKENA
ncbi:TRAP transporter small permease subunit [Nitratireductor sp. ZSWI3]|uniref:TRAP transporter small permease subunit n=1 Tax=Nitratireductor sp. ZSWI3 TaxID=2966359 RepID=UPI00214FA716|nr:TRAP transporter small permease [Nitratireductor sp. ZSWI3]MCR4265264.1 TRAP transporter small permease [Nitratireductor sp. ZSWI3]